MLGTNYQIGYHLRERFFLFSVVLALFGWSLLADVVWAEDQTGNSNQGTVSNTQNESGLNLDQVDETGAPLDRDALLRKVEMNNTGPKGLSEEQVVVETYRHFELSQFEGGAQQLQSIPEPISPTEGWATILKDKFEGADWPSVTKWSLVQGWGKEDYRSCEANFSAYCCAQAVSPPGPYPNNYSSRLVSVAKNLSVASDADVTFQYWLNTEQNYDWFSYLVSINGSDWYGYQVSGSLQSCNSVNFDLTSVPGLGNVCGHSQVWIAFEFSSDLNTQREGVYLDNIEWNMYSPYGVPDLVCPYVYWKSAQVCVGENFWIEPHIQNDGDATAGASVAKLYVSRDNDFDISDDYQVLPPKNVPALSPGSSVDIRWDFVWENESGAPLPYNAWVVVRLDADQQVVESDENNKFKTINNITVNDCGQPCSITVTQPAGGVIWDEGTGHTIYWNSQNASGNVKISYSLNGGTSWTVITSSTTNDGSHYWILPQVSSTTNQARVKVEDVSNPGCSGTTNNFTIRDVTPCNITVTQPVGGVVWDEGTGHTINWTSQNAGGTVNIYYSLNGGASWTTIVTSTTNDGAHYWTVPQVSSTTNQARVKVEDAGNPGCSGTSNGFTIRDVTPCNIVITQPSGGVSWDEGTIHAINWTSQNTSGIVKISYSINGGASWTVIESSSPDDGATSWMVPNVSSTTNQAKIKVEDKNNSSCSGTSNNFTIRDVSCSIAVTQPTSGVSWDEGTGHTINWTSQNASGNVKISYSLNGGGSWTTIVSSTTNDGSHYWTVPQVSSTTNQAKVKVEDVSNASCSGTSNNFTIRDVTPCGIVVTQPASGVTWDEGTGHTINWTSQNTSGSVNISYSLNGGASWTSIISSSTDDGSHYWVVPQVSSTTNQAQVKVVDASNVGCSGTSNNFTIRNVVPCNITVTQPSGGETWDENTVHVINWTSQNTSGNVKLSYSLNNGTTWTTITASTPDDGSHNWTIPQVSSTTNQAKVKAEDVANVACSGTSNSFTIRKVVPPCPLVVVIPNGGEAWPVGTQHNIGWVPSGQGGNVKIEYSTNGGGSWMTVTSSTNDVGCYSWTVPNNWTNQARIKITSLNNPSCSDASNADFTIGSCPTPYVMATDISGESGSQTVDIKIGGNVNPISAFGFRLNFNSNHLAFVEVQKGDLTADWIQVDGSEISPGVVNVGGFHTTAIPPGSNGIIAKIVFNIVCPGCVACDQSQLWLSNLLDHLVGMNICNGVFEFGTACALGDVNMDGNITPADALCAFQTFLNGGTPTQGSECDNECGIQASDANCDGTVTPADALLIFQAFLGGQSAMECPNGLAKIGRKNQMVSLPDIVGLPGDKISVPVVVDNPAGLSAFGLRFSYPMGMLEYEGIKRGPLTENWTELDAKVNGAGEITIGGFSPAAINSNDQSVLFELKFVVREKATGSGELVVTELLDELCSSSIKSGSINTNIAGLAADEYGLAQNHPNPFNMKTEIVYRLREAGPVSISILDVTGREVRSLQSSTMAAGTHRLNWDGKDSNGRDVPTGIYICTLRTVAEFSTIKMLLLK